MEVLGPRNLLSTLTVLNNLDSGAGSLRDAIKHASSGDTIQFAPSVNGQTITLTSGELAISKSLDIEGPGPDKVAISGNGSSRVFHVDQNQQPVIVTIAGLTIENGLDAGLAYGGGILNINSTLYLRNDVFFNNVVIGHSYGTPGEGGAVFNRGNLTVSLCTFTGNQALGGYGICPRGFRRNFYDDPREFTVRFCLSGRSPGR